MYPPPTLLSTERKYRLSALRDKHINFSEPGVFRPEKEILRHIWISMNKLIFLVLFVFVGMTPVEGVAGLHRIGLCGDAIQGEDFHPSIIGYETELFDSEAQQRLWEFLKFISVLVSNYSQEWDQNRPLSILNVAAAAAPENYLYSQFFGSAFFPDPSPGARIWSIEKNQSLVNLALSDNQMLRNEGHEDLAASVLIHQGDASDPAVFKNIPSADILIIRHPNAGEAVLQAWRDEIGWQEVFQNAFSNLSPGGIAIITFYFPNERKMIGSYWKNNPHLKIIGEGVNPYSNGLFDSSYVILTKTRGGE